MADRHPTESRADNRNTYISQHREQSDIQCTDREQANNQYIEREHTGNSHRPYRQQIDTQKTERLHTDSRQQKKNTRQADSTQTADKV